MSTCTPAAARCSFSRSSSLNSWVLTTTTVGLTVTLESQTATYNPATVYLILSHLQTRSDETRRHC